MAVQHICVETDATQVKEALENDEYRLSAMGGLIVELKFLLNSEFSICNIQVCVTK